MFKRKEELRVSLRCIVPAVLAPVLLGGCGTTAHLADMSYTRNFLVEPPEAPNPALDGPYTYRTYFYGSGDDKHRVEYGAGVDFATDPVNAEAFMDAFGKLRKYWGFDRDSLPLNGRVWFPGGDGPFPLVLILHGNHAMKRFSDPGYEYLATLLASRGFITASVDENFLNQHFAGENDARAFVLLEHLELWKRWNRTPGHAFEGRVDMERIALIGHSRGGESVAHAAVFNRLERYPDDAMVTFDYNFAIRSVIAIAPPDEQYKPAGHSTTLQDVNYLVIHGGHDADVRSFTGLRQYNRTYFTGESFCFKSAIYIYRANHSRFNSTWGNADAPPPAAWLINDKPVMDPAKQRHATRVLVSAFLEATLHDANEYLPVFIDVRSAATWLPEDIYVSQYRDSSFQVIADFEEDFDVTTGTIPGVQLVGEDLVTWKEAYIPHRSAEDSTQENSTVVLEWDNQQLAESEPGQVGSYTVALSSETIEDLQLDPNVNLALSAASEDLYLGEPLDLTIELTDEDGDSAEVPLSAVGLIHPALSVRLMKWRWLEKMFGEEPAERILQTYEIPMSLFIEANASFDPAKLDTIRLLFDRSERGAIILDDIGISR